MASKFDRALAHFVVVVRNHLMTGGTIDALMAMHEHAVVEHGNECR